MTAPWRQLRVAFDDPTRLATLRPRLTAERVAYLLADPADRHAAGPAPRNARDFDHIVHAGSRRFGWGLGPARPADEHEPASVPIDRLEMITRGRYRPATLLHAVGYGD